MDNDYFNIIVFDHMTLRTKHLKVRKETFKIAIYLLTFFQVSLIFLFCDYLHVKKKACSLNQLRQEAQIQRSQIQSFSVKIQGLENRLFRLKDFDSRIRFIASLEKDHETTPFIGMGGSLPSKTERELKEQNGEGDLTTPDEVSEREAEKLE
jgi:hypothetical protein